MSAIQARVLLPLVVSFGVGLLSALQARVNGQLAIVLENGLEAAVYSFGSGLIVLTVILLVRPSIRAGVARVPRAIRAGELKWWQALGGVLGGFFVGAQTAAVPLVGVAVFTVAIVAGQSTNSIVVDRIGLGPAGVQPVTVRRVVSAVIAVIAVTVAVSHRFTSPDFAPWAVALAFVAGLLIAVQQAINGRTARAAGHPMSATFLNFLFGTIALGIAFGLVWALAGGAPHSLPPGPWWLYTGGVIGIVFIAGAAWAVPIVGVLQFALLTIAGQLSGALILDIVAPTAATSVAPTLVLGVVLAFVAVAVAARGRARR